MKKLKVGSPMKDALKKSREQIKLQTLADMEKQDQQPYTSDTTVSGNFPLRGRPMIDYVLGWFASNGGIPAEGERNDRIYRCALYFRNFTDFQPSVLAENIPSFGLGEAQMMEICTAACRFNRAKYWPVNPEELLTDEEEDDENENENENKLPQWPPLVQLFVDKSDPRFKAATVLCMLPILGGLATDLRMVFPDGEVHSPSFMAVIIATQASGKSYARRIWRELTHRLHEDDAAAWEQERLWRETLRDSARDFKKVDGATKDPEVVIRLVPSKITEPQFFKRLHYSKGKHLIGFYEEIDSLTKEAKGGSYDDKRDLFREAFDNAEHGRDVANVDSFSGMERIFYNFLALGTPASVMRFYNNPEDGLVSRTIFYQLPIDVFDSLPRHERIGDTERDMIRKTCDILIDLKQWEGLQHDSEGKVLIETEPINAIWDSWRKVAEDRAIRSGSEAEGIFLKRASVIAWRACCVMWVLWGLQEDEATLQNLREEFFWIADTVLHEQVALFGEALAAAQVGRKKYAGKGFIFDKLPDEFTANDIMDISSSSTLKSATSYTTRWLKRGMIVRTSRGHYKKIKKQ
ncbi:MAG: DUF3987 domain-containing protein [Bacteroidaceae bacterium]|nr:DUF3987 domain-containing protein [Bacteroidaceae bacterium]